jgi:hypothetical protein
MIERTGFSDADAAAAWNTGAAAWDVFVEADAAW